MGKFAGVAVVLLLIGACGGDESASEPTTSAELPVDPEVFTMHVVREEVAAPCDEVEVGSGEIAVEGGEDGDETCLVLGPPLIDANDVESAMITRPGSSESYDVAVQLDESGSTELDEQVEMLFASGGRLAVLTQGRLISAPEVNAPEVGGRVVASGLSRTEATALVRSLGGDPTVPEADPASPSLERAQAVCESYLEELDEASAVGFSAADTAGEVTDLQELLGQDPIEPWRSLPAEHFVAQCGYLSSTDSAPTTVCDNGDVVSLGRPLQFLVDEEGRSSEVPFDEDDDLPTCP